MLLERYQQIERVTKYSNYYLGKGYTWLSTPLTERAAAWGMHPNSVTLISLVVASVGCFFVAAGTGSGIVIGALFLYLSYVLDWCDGQLARFTGKVSPFGGWLDQICDRLKETGYVFAVAYGYFRATGSTTVWIWAFLSLFFLFLLEYYGQMSRSIPDVQTNEGASPSANGAGHVKPVRRIVIDFSIDEQYAVLVAGLLLVGSLHTLEAIAILAGLMAVYKPFKGWTRYFKSQRGKQ